MTGCVNNTPLRSLSEINELIFHDFITNKECTAVLLGEGSADLTEPEIVEVFSTAYQELGLVLSSDMVKRVQAWIKLQQPPEYGPSLYSLECSFSQFIGSPAVARYLSDREPGDAYICRADAQIITIVSGCGKDKAIFTQKDLPRPS